MQKLGFGICEPTELTNNNITTLISLVKTQVFPLRHLKTIESRQILKTKKTLR